MDVKVKKDWGWVKDWMPRVAALMNEKRKAVGSEWVNECWRKGVIEQVPGYFHAREGALAIGVPSDAQAELRAYVLEAGFDGAAFLSIKDKP